MGVKGALLAYPQGQLRLAEVPPAAWKNLADAAVNAANLSYGPYSGPAGVALQFKDGALALGPYIDNAAFNPSLPALQVALVSMLQQNLKAADIVRAVLVERKNDRKSQAANTRALLASLAPGAELAVYSVK